MNANLTAGPRCAPLRPRARHIRRGPAHKVSHMLQHMHQRLHMHYCRGRAERLCRARVCARQTLYTAGRRHSPSGITRQGGTKQGARALPVSPPPPPPNSSPCLGRLPLHPAAAAPARLSRAASVRGRLEVEGEASAAEHPERQLRRAVAQRGEVLGVVVFEAHLDETTRPTDTSRTCPVPSRPPAPSKRTVCSVCENWPSST